MVKLELFECCYFARVCYKLSNVNQERTGRNPIFFIRKQRFQNLPQNRPHHESHLHRYRGPSPHLRQTRHQQTLHRRPHHRNPSRRTSHTRTCSVQWCSWHCRCAWTIISRAQWPLNDALPISDYIILPISQRQNRMNQKKRSIFLWGSDSIIRLIALVDGSWYIIRI